MFNFEYLIPIFLLSVYLIFNIPQIFECIRLYKKCDEDNELLNTTKFDEFKRVYFWCAIGFTALGLISIGIIVTLIKGFIGG